MKIALFGHGKMGKMVENLAKKKGFVITLIEEADVAIDFSHPDAVLANVERSAKNHVALVVGTTGWQDDLDKILRIAKKKSLSLVYGENFSLGVQLFVQLSQFAAGVFSDYDLSIEEKHHEEKVDIPSGTALLLRRHLPEDSIPISSIRKGAIKGIHTLLLDSPLDRITLSHEAKSREGFASGALFAAKWLLKNPGIYHFSEVIRDQVQSHI